VSGSERVPNAEMPAQYRLAKYMGAGCMRFMIRQRVDNDQDKAFDLYKKALSKTCQGTIQLGHDV